ncbi:MAG: HU family DNA-binding protein [Bacteroidia bacterium]
MKKSDIIKKMAKDANLTEVEAAQALESFIKAVKSALDAGEPVSLSGLGSFSPGHKETNFELTPEAPITVNEPVLSYISSYKETISKAELLNLLGGNIASHILIDELLKITALPLKVLAERVFEMTPKTLTSYRQEKRYLPTRSVETMIKLKELYFKGIEIFQSREQFNKWLAEPAYGLGNKPPLSYISSSTGIDLIYEELLKIEFGATA